MALGLIGQNEIANLETDTGDTAVKCRRFYDPARKACLRDHKWNFAIKRSPALAENSPAPAFGWAHSFKLPTNPECLRVLELNGSDCVRWEVEGKNLLTDATTAVIKYIFDAPADQWDALFVDQFALLLASKLALAVAHDAPYSEKLLGIYERRLMDAKAVDGQESGLQEQLQSTSLTTDVRHV